MKFQAYEQGAYNGASASSGNVNDDYRMTTIDNSSNGNGGNSERKLSHHDDANSNDIHRMNYASSDDMNQNTMSSDHGDKMNSGSEDEGMEYFSSS